jgi:predicted nucleic acid-binding protein
LSLFVVDANVVAKWFVPERLSAEAMRLLDDTHELAVPDLLWPELGNVLWKKSRAAEITEREARRIVQALERIPFTVFPSRVVLEAALEMALQTGRTVYDCVYLALAVALECRMITADERLVAGLTGSPLAMSVAWLGTLSQQLDQ